MLFCAAMIGQIQRLLSVKPFEPFFVRTSDGQVYEVPTTDHLQVAPRGTRVAIYFDDDTHVTLSLLHIVAVREKSQV